MAKRDTTAENVDLAGVEAENLVVGECDGRESLVDFEERDVVFGQTGTLECIGNGVGGGDREVDWRACSVSKCNDLGQRLDTELLHLSFGSKDDSRSTVVQSRGVGGGDGAALVENGAESRDLFEFDVLVLFVFADDNVTLLVRDGDGCDLVGEGVGLPGVGGALVGFDSIGILHFTGERLCLGRVFSAVAHGYLVVYIVQTVLDDSVQCLDVAVRVASWKIVTAIVYKESR